MRQLRLRCFEATFSSWKKVPRSRHWGWTSLLSRGKVSNHEEDAVQIRDVAVVGCHQVEAHPNSMQVEPPGLVPSRSPLISSEIKRPETEVTRSIQGRVSTLLPMYVCIAGPSIGSITTCIAQPSSHRLPRVLPQL